MLIYKMKKPETVSVKINSRIDDFKNPGRESFVRYCLDRLRVENDYVNQIAELWYFPYVRKTGVEIYEPFITSKKDLRDETFVWTITYDFIRADIMEGLIVFLSNEIADSKEMQTRFKDLVESKKSFGF